MNHADTPDQDPREEPPEEYTEITEKDLLIDIAAQLDAIRRLLEQSHTRESDAAQDLLECRVCGDAIPEDSAAKHGQECFNWHSDMGEQTLMAQYERFD